MRKVAVLTQTISFVKAFGLAELSWKARIEMESRSVAVKIAAER